ncbi:MAG: AAA family ATPase [Candidatus Sericytochromatia bacterium]
MENVFLEKIIINKVRHLENIEIELSSEKKHLILTGKNGSGKTSVLLAIKDLLLNLCTNKSYQNVLKEKNMLLKQTDHDYKMKRLNEIEENRILPYTKCINLVINENNSYDFYILLGKIYEKGMFITAFFDSKRISKLNIPNGISKVNFKESYKFDDKANIDFIQYIVNLKADRSFSRDDNDLESVKKIDDWFEKFENSLKDIFNDKDLKLEFDRKNYNFDILLKGREKFDFNTLSDGYSAIISIITELILRMESKSSKNYDIQGVVLIDEIETHLHIELQKKILPFLMSFFPNIQFIVTTHSPFVLNSVNNAIIYDLENKIQVDDLSSYSYDGIVESYFDSDKYSQIIKDKVKEYRVLASNKNLTEEQEDRFIDLKMYFKTIPKFMSPELELELQQIEALRYKN